MGSAVLSPRLAAAASCVPAGSVVADVGADHAALSLFLLSGGIASSVIVSDVNQLPLERARRAIESAGFSDRAVFRLADGMLPLLDLGPDCFAVCGMGGDTIASMLGSDSSVFDGKSFVFQPMSRHESLRAALFSHGFAIDREIIVTERSRPFVVIAARRDGRIVRQASALDVLAGYERDPDPPTLAYYGVIAARLKKRIAGLERSRRDASAEKALFDGLKARASKSGAGARNMEPDVFGE